MLPTSDLDFATIHSTISLLGIKHDKAPCWSFFQLFWAQFCRFSFLFAPEMPWGLQALPSFCPQQVLPLALVTGVPTNIMCIYIYIYIYYILYIIYIIYIIYIYYIYYIYIIYIMYLFFPAPRVWRRCELEFYNVHIIYIYIYIYIVMDVYCSVSPSSKNMENQSLRYNVIVSLCLH